LAYSSFTLFDRRALVGGVGRRFITQADRDAALALFSGAIVIDTTGSMDDEAEYLKSEFQNISTAIDAVPERWSTPGARRLSRTARHRSRRRLRDGDCALRRAAHRRALLVRHRRLRDRRFARRPVDPVLFVIGSEAADIFRIAGNPTSGARTVDDGGGVVSPF